MGAIMSHLNRIDSRKTRWESKERVCAACSKQIDPDNTIFQLWCEYCDRVWCNDCWSSSVESITKLAYECCGYCSSDDLNATKATLFDLVMLDDSFKNSNQRIKLPQLCDKYDMYNRMLKVKQDYENGLDIMFGSDV